MHNPPHPGMVLREYLGDLAVITAAAHLRITRATLSRVLNGKAGVSAIRWPSPLGTPPELWMNMQSQYDLWRAAGAVIGSAKVCCMPRNAPLISSKRGSASAMSVL
jgi:addiction module HigA family antidote